MVIHPNFKTVTVTVIWGKLIQMNNKTAGNNFDSNGKSKLIQSKSLWSLYKSGCYFALPALQQTFVDFFFGFAWEFRIEKWRGFLVSFLWSPSPRKSSTKNKRATTNVQNRFVQFFLLSFLLFYYPWAKTPCFEGKSPGGKIMKKCQKVRKSAKNYETILPFSCCPLVFPWKSSTKTPQKIRGKFGAKFGAKFGPKTQNIRGTFVLQVFWPNVTWKHQW